MEPLSLAQNKAGEGLIPRSQISDKTDTYPKFFENFFTSPQELPRFDAQLQQHLGHFAGGGRGVQIQPHSRADAALFEQGQRLA